MALGYKFSKTACPAWTPQPVRSTTRSQGLFVLADRPLEQWTPELGGRVDSTEIQALGNRQVFDTLSLSAGAVVPLNERLTFKAYLSHAERAPVVEELYSDGLHLATASVELGDNSLIEETSQNIDLSLHRNGELWSYTVSVYVNQFDDFIYQRNTGEALIEDGELFPVRQWTQADATLKGLEFETDLHLLTRPRGDLHMNFWGDWVDAELDSGENLPRIVPIRLAAGLAWDAQRWHLGLDVIRTFEQNQVANDEQTTSGDTMVNLNALLRLGQGLQDWELFARVRNATDETARNHTSFLRDRAPLPGRNTTVGIRFRF